MKIDLTIESDLNCGLTAQALESVANDIIEKIDIKKPRTTVEVFLVSNERIQSLNMKHRCKDEATDVLSFPQEQFPSDKEQTLGTIFISPEFAKKEDVSCEELFVHGVLHLLGYDHETNLTNWENAEAKIGIKSL